MSSPRLGLGGLALAAGLSIKSALDSQNVTKILQLIKN
jgi:hypothetical protein